MKIKMKQGIHYIATWFYQESKEQASYYPQMGRNGADSLVHSIYMQIQVPFFRTFKHFNPDVRFLFFTNVTCLPEYLNTLFSQLDVEVIRLPLTTLPPDGWHPAWRNQFYLFDILRTFAPRMNIEDQLMVLDADCICTKSLDPLFAICANDGAVLYEAYTKGDYVINGINLEQMKDIYKSCYPTSYRDVSISYYGGEFILLRGDRVDLINEAFPDLWQQNLKRFAENKCKLNEEAHFLSVLVTHLGLANNIGNQFIKRMWTHPNFYNVEVADLQLPIWHLPYEKKRGLYYLYLYFQKHSTIVNEDAFLKMAEYYTGVPKIHWTKRLKDRYTTLCMKFRR